jgi:hypothetical protein
VNKNVHGILFSVRDTELYVIDMTKYFSVLQNFMSEKTLCLISMERVEMQLSQYKD